MKKITIYTGPHCNYCDAAKRLLTRNNASYEEINIEELGWDRSKLLEVGKSTTVPQIVIDGLAIGGYDELIKIHT